MSVVSCATLVAFLCHHAAVLLLRRITAASFFWKAVTRMVITPSPFQHTQTDEALRMLARLYHRWFMHASEAQEAVYQQIRDVLFHASDQQAALAFLTAQSARIAPAAPDAAIWQEARATLQAIIAAKGSIDALIIGQTDGFHHLCLVCSQDENNWRRVRFFNERACRPLLKPEIAGERRSVYACCQLCCQPLNPLRLVILLPMGTQKHPGACSCRTCNRAGVAFLLSIYACEPETQRICLPQVLQIVAPSKQQCREQAIKACSERGWYMLHHVAESKYP